MTREPTESDDDASPERESTSLAELDADRDFAAPWQARAFGLAVAVADAADVDWSRFQSRLAAEIERDADGFDGASEDGDLGDTADADDVGHPAAHEADYYREWLAALERLLVEDGHIDAGTLTDRVVEFADGDRTAHEFVAGDPHGHVEGLPEGHAEGADHDHDREDGHAHPH